MYKISRFKNIFSFVIGVAVGMLLFSYLIHSAPNKKGYIKTQKDYCVDGYGYLRKGTLLQIDAPFSEGFARYVLYLNLSDRDTVSYEPEDQPNLVVPYWLHRSDTISGCK